MLSINKFIKFNSFFGNRLIQKFKLINNYKFSTKIRRVVKHIEKVIKYRNRYLITYKLNNRTKLGFIIAWELEDDKFIFFERRVKKAGPTKYRISSLYLVNGKKHVIQSIDFDIKEKFDKDLNFLKN